MIRIRYMLVDHSADHDGKLAVDGVKFVHVPPMHHLAPVHHWARLDANTVFVKAVYPERNHKTLMNMSGVTVLPATFSRQTVAAAITKQNNPHHLQVLHKHPIPFDDDTITSDLVDWAAENINSVFDHEM